MRRSMTPFIPSAKSASQSFESGSAFALSVIRSVFRNRAIEKSGPSKSSSRSRCLTTFSCASTASTIDAFFRPGSPSSSAPVQISSCSMRRSMFASLASATSSGVKLSSSIRPPFPSVAVPSPSSISGASPMSKRRCEIDIPNPLFIPARSPICSAAQSVLIFSTAFLGLAASLICLLNQVSGGLQ